MEGQNGKNEGKDARCVEYILQQTPHHDGGTQDSDEWVRQSRTNGRGARCRKAEP